MEILPWSQQAWNNLWAVRTLCTEAECGQAPALREGGFCMRPPPATPQATERALGNQPSHPMDTILRLVLKIILGFRRLHLSNFLALEWDSDYLHPPRSLLRRLSAFGVGQLSPAQSLQVIKILCWGRRFPQHPCRGHTTCSALVKELLWKAGVWVFR